MSAGSRQRPPRRALPVDWIEEDAERIPAREPHGKRRSETLRRDLQKLLAAAETNPGARA